MAGEDRERIFEKALARHLRANPASGPHARDTACPDAELLAAYHERMLAPEQMISWKQHIALCSRCQEILAQLETTDELPVGASDVEQAEKVLPIVAISESQRAPAEHPLEPAAPVSVPAVRAIPTPRESQQRRLVHWRWLAPAGAIAAGLLLWITIRQTHVPEFELAKNQPGRVAVATPSSPASTSQPAPTLQSQNEADATKTADSNRSLAAQSEFSHSESEGKPVLQDNFRAVLKQKAVGAPAEKAKTDADRRQLADKSALASDSRQSDLNALSKDGVEERKDRTEFANRAASPPALAPSPPKASLGGVAGGMIGGREREKLTRDQALDEAKKEAPAAAAESTEVQSQTQTINGAVPMKAPQMMRLTRGQAPAVIPAPSGKTIWRAGAAGIVENSTNFGSTWKLQRTGVISDLLAGSAPSDEVCWIVGRSGTILRTTDRGAHWVKIHAPVEEDFSAVFAVDGSQATVSTMTHTGYTTTDGGLTWTPVTDQ